jgi:hypothetical protein
MRSVVAVAAILAATPALAAQCGPVDLIKQFVTGDRYSERALFEATTECQSGECPITIFGNAKTGTFTVIVEPQPGIWCIYLGGQNLAPAKQEPQGSPM